MLENKWLKHIDENVNEILDITRGKLEVKEVKYRVASLLTYKYVSENQQEQNSLYVPEEYLWQQITRSGINIKQRVKEAQLKIEEHNKEINGILSFFSFENLSDEDLFKIIATLNQYNFDKNRQEFHIGNFVQNLVHSFIEKEGIQAGEESSPAEIAWLLPKLLHITEGTVSDPTSGIGDFLIEAHKYAQVNGTGKVKLYGQEINQSSLILSKMIFILHGLKVPGSADIKLGDTITEPQWKEGDYLKQFDYVLTQFPFALKNWGHEIVKDDLYGRFIYGTPSASFGDMAFVLHALATLKKEGKAAIIVPQGVLVRGGQEQKIRERLLREDVIEAVIGLPSNIFLGTSIPTAVLVLNKNKIEALRGKVLLINAENDYERRRMKNTLRLKDIKKVVSTFRDKQEIESYSKLADLQEIEQQSYSLLPSRFFAKNEVETKIGRVIVDHSKYDAIPYEKLKLTDVVDVNRGINLPKDDEVNEVTHKLINLVDVQEGHILKDQLTDVSVTDEKRRNKYELQSGDIIISARGTALKIAVIPENQERLLCSSNFMFLRVRDRGEFNPYYIKAFLESPIGVNYIHSYQRGATVTVLSSKDMQNFQIPALSIKSQENIVSQLNKTEEEHRRVLREAERKYKLRYIEMYEYMGIGDTFQSNI